MTAVGLSLVINKLFFSLLLLNTNKLFIITDVPSAPIQPELTPKSLTLATLSWTLPSDTICVDKYSITLTNITEGNTSYIYNTTTNTTGITISDLTQGVEYFFTVSGIDTGGRIGEKSVPSQTVTLSSQCSPKINDEMLLNISSNV